MFMFAVAAMDGVADHFRSNPLLVIELTALAFALLSSRPDRQRLVFLRGRGRALSRSA